jgi:hypothetical protein
MLIYYKHLFSLNQSELKFIKNDLDYIDKWIRDHDRYGSSWFDVLILKWKIKKLNKKLSKININDRVNVS